MADRVIEEHHYSDNGGTGMGALAIVLVLLVLLAIGYFVLRNRGSVGGTNINVHLPANTGGTTTGQ